MGDKDGISSPACRIGKSRGSELWIKSSRIGRHLSPELVFRFFSPGNLYIFKVMRVMAEAENIKPQRFVSRRYHLSFHSAASGSSSSWLIHDVHLVAFTKKQSLKPFPAIRRSFPAGPALPGAMQEKKSILPGICRYLIKHIAMVHMLFLSLRRQGMGFLIGPFLTDHSAACGKTPLCFYQERFSK